MHTLRRTTETLMEVGFVWHPVCGLKWGGNEGLSIEMSSVHRVRQRHRVR